MKIIIDTREKKIEHIVSWFERNGIDFVFKKLDEGDYQIEGNEQITIDRKQNLTEMYNCIVGDRSRFLKEVRRCYGKRTKLVLLIEHGGKIKSIEDVANWNNKYGLMSSGEFARRLYNLSVSYNVDLVFCDKRNTAKKIIEILGNKS